MIDHLLNFPDEAAAQVALPTYWVPATDDSPGAWRGDVCIPGVSVYAVTGTTTVTDPDTGQSFEQDVRQAYSGWFIVVSRPMLDPALRDLPNNACRLITDRDAADRGDSFILYTAPDLDPAVLSVAHVEPLFAGSDYPFGNPK